MLPVMRRLVLPFLASLLLVSACTSGAPEPTSSPEPDDPTVRRYVAIGDSYTAGPGIPPEDSESGGCERSDSNYPSLVARRLGADLVDASCGSATTTDVLSAPQSRAGATLPQIEQLSADADLVTVGIGANNGFATPMFVSCIYAKQTEKDCPAWFEDDMPGVLSAIEPEVAAVLDQVERRAPDATVLLVGYLSVAADGPCSAMPVAERSLEIMRDAQARLEKMLERVAKRGGATFVPMGRLSKDHGPCSDKPWVNGVNAGRGDGQLLHPRRSGMVATADAVVDAVRDARA